MLARMLRLCTSAHHRGQNVRAVLLPFTPMPEVEKRDHKAPCGCRAVRPLGSLVVAERYRQKIDQRRHNDEKRSFSVASSALWHAVGIMEAVHDGERDPERFREIALESLAKAYSERKLVGQRC
jgi:hypothetical protein